MGWMKIDLKTGAINKKNWCAIPGILYDTNNAVIDTASDFGPYLEAISANVSAISWWHPCLQASQSFSKLGPGNWRGTNFNIYPGQGVDITVSADCTIYLLFGQGYKKHIICNDGVNDIYCEWLGQEEFDPLEG